MLPSPKRIQPRERGSDSKRTVTDIAMNMTSFSVSQRNSGDYDPSIFNINFPTLQAYTIELAVRSPTVRNQSGKIFIQANSEENRQTEEEKITT